MKSAAFSAPEAWQIIRSEAPPAWVLDHVEAVRALAGQMAALVPCDQQLVEVGAILHDLGRAQTQDTMHTPLGAARAVELGVPAPVVRIIACHTGAGIDRREAKRLGWPEGDYVPKSIEERIVCHADNLHSGNKRLTLQQVLQKYEAKSLPEAAARIKALHRALELEMGVDLDALGQDP